MNLDNYSSKIAHLPLNREQKPSSPYRELLDELARTTTRDLQIVIDCQRFKQITENSRTVVECLGDEIRLWAEILGPRKVRSLYLFHPHLLLEPFELTRVLHLIASNFQISGDQDKRHIVISDLDGTNTDYLALLKGLGFNIYQIIVPKEQLGEVDKIARKVAILKDFAFEWVGIQMDHPDCLDDIRVSIKSIEKRCNTDYVCVGSTWDTFDIVSSRDDSITENLQVDCIDSLELGPEGASSIDGHKVQNYCSVEKYTAALGVERLPIHVHQTR